MGGIGIGGRGGDHLPIFLEFPQVQFVAVCEVQKDRRDAAKRKVDSRYGNTNCAAYRDMRDLLAERTDLDAVLIATGDRVAYAGFYPGDGSGQRCLLREALHHDRR